MGAGSGTGRGRFVVLDGVDGCGKSTQAERLVAALARDAAPGLEPLHVRDPGTTAGGEQIRQLLLRFDLELVPAAEALLFAAARRQLLEERIAPALAAGRDVVCERFHPSTFAYQSVASGIDERELLDLLNTWANEPSPDIILWLDVPWVTARRAVMLPTDRIEARGLEFQKRVAEGMARWQALDAPRTVRVDASGQIDEVAARVLAALDRGEV